MHTLRVSNFAQIRSAEISFGDLTVLVGAQGSGKSLLLQLFKLGLDAAEIVPALRDAGHFTTDKNELLDVYFGQGMRHSWRTTTSVKLDRKTLDPDRIARSRPTAKEGGVFYIPAHRALLLADGWPAPFLKLSADTPAVARLFSQNLFSLFGNPRDTRLFPVERRLKKTYRDLIDRAVFHGGQVVLDKKALRKRLELRFGDARLPFMTWTAGQREFAPLLLGLYHLLPPRKLRKRKEIDWVVIEEPEMGLHPHALVVVMLLVLDLLWRGYRVIITTHAPLVLDTVYAVQKFQELEAEAKLLPPAFGLKNSQAIASVMRAALEKEYRTYFLRFDEQLVDAVDISELDPFAESGDEAGWGGLTGFSSRFGEAVAAAVAEFED